MGQGGIIGVVRATLWIESGMVKTIKMVCLDDIYAAPEHRRDGVATRLFEAVEQCFVPRYRHDPTAVCV